MEELFFQLQFQAERKEQEGSIVEAVADYHKLLCLLSGESLRGSGCAGLEDNLYLQEHVRHKISSLSEQLPFEQAVFKSCGVPEDFQFSLSESCPDIRSVVQDALASNMLLFAPLTSTPSSQVPFNAPKLSLLSDQKEAATETLQRPQKKSFSYEKSATRSSQSSSTPRTRTREEDELESVIANPFKTAGDKLVSSRG